MPTPLSPLSPDKKALLNKVLGLIATLPPDVQFELWVTHSEGFRARYCAAPNDNWAPRI